MKILLITVGGSCAPVVTAIETLKPEHVVFFCSEGPRGSRAMVEGPVAVCAKGEQALPNIPTQARLANRYSVVGIENPDDFLECHTRIFQEVQRRREEDSSELLADFTGGTKTMSVALAMAALAYRLPLHVTTGFRSDLDRVRHGESTQRVNTSAVHAIGILESEIPSLLAGHDYPAAEAVLREQLTLELPRELRDKSESVLGAVRGLNAWDRFDHSEAWRSMLPLLKDFPSLRPLALFLKRVIHSRKNMDDAFAPPADSATRGHGYEIVEDLLLNAERRAAQGRYDDALGRLYRALELLAQLRLFTAHAILSGDLDLDKVPADARPEYAARRKPENGKIQLGCRDSYELLCKFADDPLGQLYQEPNRNWRGRLLDALRGRNNSLFAHGFTPITEADYRRFGEPIVEFIRLGIVCVAGKENAERFPPIPFPASLNRTGP